MLAKNTEGIKIYGHAISMAFVLNPVSKYSNERRSSYTKPHPSGFILFIFAYLYIFLLAVASG
jgi:hypothetical protein